MIGILCLRIVFFCRKIPGNVQENSRTIPGNVQQISRTYNTGAERKNNIFKNLELLELAEPILPALEMQAAQES